MPEVTVSALLPVHAGVEPAHLEAALDSLLAQTRPADEVVVVEDGPLTPAHLAVLDQLAERHPSVVRVALDHNQGAGVANGIGLMRCAGTWVAKVDADDILLPDRFERQLMTVESGRLDVCGTSMLEFASRADNVMSRRVMPRSHRDIARRMRVNNPINHPTAMYRRQLAVQVGGYPSMRHMQDYVLFARLLAAGATMTNLEDDLVLFRAGAALQKRRSTRGFASLELELQRELYSLGIIGRWRMAVNLVWRIGYRRLPKRVMAWVQHRVVSEAASHEPRPQVPGHHGATE